MRVSHKDLTQLGEICSSVCYHLTAHLAAVAAGVPPSGPPEVSQIYQLAAKLPPPKPAQWQALAGSGDAPSSPRGVAAGHALPLADGAERAPGKRLKWTPELEAELIRLVEDDEFRMEKLGKEGTRAGTANYASVGRHFGFSSGNVVKSKYCELKGLPKESGAGGKKKAEGEAAPDGEKPAGKKAKVKAEAKVKEEAAVAAAAPAAAPASGKKAKAAAAATPPAAPAAAPTPASAGGTGGAEWSKKQGQELVKLVEDAEARKTTLGKKSLKWKAIAKHFNRHKKECRKRYQQLTGKTVPEDDE